MNERVSVARHAVVTTLFISLLALAIATPGMAATYYVATTGNDANAGSEQQPFRTITFAYGRANAGDTIIVKPGTYTDFTTSYGLRLHRSGTAGSPITLKSEQRGAAILDGQNRSDRPQVVWFSGQYNILEGFDIRNGYLGGVILFGSYNQVRNNIIHHNGNIGDPSSTKGQDGIYSDRGVNGTVYWANYIHHNGRIALDSNFDHGLYLTGDNELVANNIVTHNSAYGIHIAGYTTITNLRVYNNVVAWNGRAGLILWMQMSGVDIKNNVLSNNRTYGIDTYDAHGTGVIIDRNIYFSNGSGTNRLNHSGSDVAYSLGTSIAADPRFANPSEGDFRLQSSSPAIDAGHMLTAVPTDFDAVSRPRGGSTDIGAHEHDTTVAVPAAPANLRIAS